MCCSHMQGRQKGDSKHRKQFVFGVDNLPCKPGFLGIEGVLSVQHCIQNDAAAPNVRDLQPMYALSASERSTTAQRISDLSCEAHGMQGLPGCVQITGRQSQPERCRRQHLLNGNMVIQAMGGGSSAVSGLLWRHIWPRPG